MKDTYDAVYTRWLNDPPPGGSAPRVARMGSREAPGAPGGSQCPPWGASGEG